jgi:Peptidase family M1 domain
MRLTLALFTLVFLCTSSISAQWQQHVAYKIEVDVQAELHKYTGYQELTYTNNSPDTIFKVFYHLYLNAFQPGSMMDVRNQFLTDSDKRVGGRIKALKPDEIGYLRVKELKQGKKTLKTRENETIFEATLSEPLLPGKSTLLKMVWDAQLPLQVRRNGRDNSEGIELSMAQWYPKLCAYDADGWHTDQYVGREFYADWGNFAVDIRIDQKYIVAAGGVLSNANEIGYGYTDQQTPGKADKDGKLTWRWKADNVHDFVWAADPDYTHTHIKAQDGSIMRFFWQKGKGYDEQWQKLPAAMDRARTLMNERFGKYPYPEYSFIQAGDGGMEYPMATLITGNRPLNSLIGVAVHEQLHSWYQMMLATNESLYAWMDEGFTSYAEVIVENELAREGIMPGKVAEDNPFAGNYKGYVALAKSGKEEPLTTHADYFNTNYAYGLAAYVKGCVFVRQLEYIIGSEAVARGMLRYYNEQRFKHPDVNDFVRIMEKESGIELDWYKQGWVDQTWTIDYAVAAVEKESRKTTEVTIERVGRLAMPVEVLVTFKNGDTEIYYAPLEAMNGIKPAAKGDPKREMVAPHRWVDGKFTFEVDEKLKKIKRVEVNHSKMMADINPDNDAWVKE